MAPPTEPPSTEPSESTLSEVPDRAFKFISYVSRTPEVYAALANAGLTDAMIKSVWNDVLAVSGYNTEHTASTAGDPAVRKAIAELDAWDEPNFRKARAALRHNHPAQHAFVFADLAPATGPNAVRSVALFLDRCDALDSGKERKATRAEDHAALATLSERGITAEVRRHLRELVTLVRTPVAPAEPDPKAAQAREARRVVLLRLWRFLDEWTDVARSDIRRGDHLINLGIGKRKSRAKKPAGEPQGGERK